MQLVEHRIYEKGKIQKKRFGGFELYVEFRRWNWEMGEKG